MKFGKINSLNLRDVWPNEAKDFTPWLSENIAALGEALGMELELKEEKQQSGIFHWIY